MSKSITFGPNSSSPDLLGAIRSPGKWTTPNARCVDLDWWHFVSDVDQAKGDLPGWLGPNTYAAIRDVGLGHLPSVGVDLLVSGEAAKSHDPDAEGNERKWLDVVIPRVYQAGGTIAGITLDEPLTATKGLRSFPDIVTSTARVVRSVMRSTVLYEAWPNNSATSIGAFIAAVDAQSGGLITRFILDVDVNAMRQGDSLSATVVQLRTLCNNLGIEFGIAGMAQIPQGASTDEEFLSNQQGWLARVVPMTSHVTIESWNEHQGRKDIPRCLGAQSLASNVAWVERTYNPPVPPPDPFTGPIEIVTFDGGGTPMPKIRIKNTVQGQPDQYMEVSKTGVVSFQPEKPGNKRQEFETVPSGQ